CARDAGGSSYGWGYNSLDVW
nr:immunoglobulin heavy chain junction region [Macaca mulatta]